MSEGVSLPLLIGFGAAIALLPSLLVVALCTIGALRRDRHEGNSRPAVDDEVAPVVAGRAAIRGLVAANDARAASARASAPTTSISTTEEPAA